MTPQFIEDVYSVSPYGDVALMNKMYFATAGTAQELARRYGAKAVLSQTSPETGGVLTRWRVCRVPKEMLPPAGARVQSVDKILAFLTLPVEFMECLQFPNGTLFNAGYLADIFRRDPEDKFPGLADKYVKAELASEGIFIQ